MRRNKLRMHSAALLVLMGVLCALSTARAEQPSPPPPPSPPAYWAPPPASSPSYYAPSPSYYPAAPYVAAPYTYAPPTYDTASAHACTKKTVCDEGTMCVEGKCVPYRTEGYGGEVLLGHLLLGPIGSSAVHFAHKQIGKGFLSLAGATGSFFLGGAMVCNAAHGCTYGEFLAGALFSYIAFAVIDTTVIAKRKVPDTRFMARPVIVPTQTGVTGGMRAQF